MRDSHLLFLPFSGAAAHGPAGRAPMLWRTAPRAQPYRPVRRRSMVEHPIPGYRGFLTAQNCSPSPSPGLPGSMRKTTGVVSKPLPFQTTS